MPYSDEPISVIEDLDPEPPPRQGGRQAWELVLGLLLIVGVLGFAGWQWLVQSEQQSNYAAGANAISLHDWDAAQLYFTKATGYHDADAQAQAAATTIARRDDRYNAALNAEKSANWIACLKSIQEVAQIESGYKDSARMEQEASSYVYRDALSGTVALRTSANPPGLYYYGPAGWVWLPHSDIYSRVQGNGSSDRLIYDVPSANWVPEPTPGPFGYVTGAPRLEGRNLVAVRLPDLSQPITLSIDPSRYGGYEWSDKGVWAVRIDSPDAWSFSDLQPVRLPALGQGNYTITYQSYSSPITGTVRPDVSKDKAQIMDIDPNSDRYLLANWSGDDAMGDVTATTVTKLYVGQAGGDRQLLYTLNGGGFISAQFSPDGVHALLDTYVPVDETSEAETVLLITLDGSAPPQTLAENTATISSRAPGEIYFWLNAAFISSGPYTGDVVITDDVSDHYNVRVIDTHWGSPFIGLEVPTTNFLIWSLYEGHNGEAVLVGLEEPHDYYQTSSYLASVRFIVLSPGVPPKLTSLLINQDENSTNLDYATITGDNLVFSTNWYGINLNTNRVFSFPMGKLGAQGEQPTTTYSRTGKPADDPLDYSAQSFGPGLFAYTQDGNLHALSYDGSEDVVLEHNISYLYSTVQGYVWRRPLR